MPVKLTGLNGVLKRLQKAQKLSDNSALEVAALASDMIKQHTLSGQDGKGRKMKRYSDGYSRSQGKKGRSSNVNLFDTGDMFRAMMFKKHGRSGAVIYFNRADANIKAVTHHNGKKGAEKVSTHTRKVSHAFGKKISPKTVVVSAHTRQANMPKRPFFGIQPREKKKIMSFLEKKAREALK